MKTKIKLDEHGNPRFTAPDGTTYVGKPDTVAHILHRTEFYFGIACKDGLPDLTALGSSYARALLERGTATADHITAAAGFGAAAPALFKARLPIIGETEMPAGSPSRDIVCGLHVLAKSPSLPEGDKSGLLAREITVLERVGLTDVAVLQP